MSGHATREEGNFLNLKQKEIKQRIMEDLLEALFGNIQKNQINFPNVQSVLDLMFSVLVMFNRDTLVHIVTGFNLEHNRKDIMKNLFETIKEEVNKKVRLGMM